MQNFIIETYKSVGELLFSMNKKEIRNLLGNEYKEFKKSKYSKTFTDDYKFAHIYYNEDDKFEAIEFFNEQSISLTLNNKELIGIPYNDLKDFILTLDDELLIESDNFTSKKLGIGAYAPGVSNNNNTIPETIIVFKNGYYE